MLGMVEAIRRLHSLTPGQPRERLPLSQKCGSHPLYSWVKVIPWETAVTIFHSVKSSACVAAVAAVFALAGCGDSLHEALTSVTVTPSTVSATHGSANNTIQFMASGGFATFGTYHDSTATAACRLHTVDTTRPLTQVTWTTSDSTNTSVNANGLATCTGSTTATITALASGICGGVMGTATLTCN
jgi:hypothetical protein